MTDEELIAALEAPIGPIPVGSLPAIADRIRALIAERDEARADAADITASMDQVAHLLALETGRADRAEGLLREARRFMPCPWPGDNEHELNKLHWRIDAALETEAAPMAEYPDDDALKRSLATAFPEDWP